MAKINLLTIHWGCSYGAMLQTYSTVKLLEDQGHHVSVINLRHPNTKFSETHKTRTSFLNLIREFQFALFRWRYFPRLTKKMYSLKKQYISPADYTVVGSDQVWNSAITAPFKSAFFLDFVDDGSKKIALSSSFGTKTWNETEEYTELVKKCLQDFSAVSVRESNGVEILKNTFQINAEHLLDPTLAYGKFENLLKSRKRKPQIFPFLLKNDSEQKMICNTLSSHLKVPVYKTNRKTILFDRSIHNWLDNIHNSDFVITDSFHGLAFSIMFHKQFIVLCADERKLARLSSLLALTGLQDRFVASMEDLNSRMDSLIKDIDFGVVDEILSQERINAMDFIRRNIPNIPN